MDEIEKMRQLVTEALRRTPMREEIIASLREDEEVFLEKALDIEARIYELQLEIVSLKDEARKCRAEFERLERESSAEQKS